MGWLYEDGYIGSSAARGPDDASWHLQMLKATANTQLQGVRVWKAVNDGGANGVPDAVRVWDYDANSQLVDLTLTEVIWPSGSSGGWANISVGTPIDLTSGTRYVVGYHIPTGANWAFSSGAPSMPSPPAFDFEAVGPSGSAGSYTGRWYGGTTIDLSTDPTWYGDHRCGADAWIGSTGPSPSSGDLPAWLSSDSGVNTHQADGLPWLTKTAVDAIKNTTDILGAQGSTSPDWIKATWKLAGNLTDLEYAAAQALLKNGKAEIDQILGRTGPPGSGGGSGTVSDDVLTGLQGAGQTPDLSTLRAQLDLSVDPADTSRWTISDAITGIGWAFVDAPADMYRVQINSAGSAQPTVVIASSVTWYPRLGWWAPVRDGHVGPRGFLEFSLMDLRWSGFLMHGLLLYVGPGVEWTVHTYLLDR